jgi:hypothetical protein
MYTPAFPRVTADLAATASLVGLTLTAFFIGLALGQLVGGPWSDQRGRHTPLLIGGVICTIGAIGCARSRHRLARRRPGGPGLRRGSGGYRQPFTTNQQRTAAPGSSTTTLNAVTPHSEDNPRSADYHQPDGRVHLERRRTCVPQAWLPATVRRREASPK